MGTGLSVPHVPLCGDGIVQEDEGETCDPPGSIPDTPPENTNKCRFPTEDSPACTYCGDGIVNNGEECDDPNYPRCTKDCKIVECELDVEKFCTVPEPPVSGNACEGDVGGVLELVLEYLGGDCGATTNTQEGKAKCDGDTQATAPVDVVVTKDADKIAVDGVIGGAGAFVLGDTFTITNLEDAPKLKKLKASTKLRLDGPGGSQSPTIHTSCSKALTPGDVFGGLRLVSVTTEKGGTSTLPSPEPPVLSEVCEVVGRKPDACADGKPIALVFRYTGAACQNPLPNPQSGKATCSGSPGGDGVSVTGTKVSADPATVDVGDLVTIAATGDKFESQTDLKVGGQALSIHTSCSQDLIVGDVFGSLTLVGFIPQGGSLEQDGNVIYTYRVRHNELVPVSVNLYDDQGLLGPDGTDVLVPAGQTVTLTEEAVITETTFNVVTATDNDEICARDEAAVLVEVVEPPGSCADGKPKTLVFEYTGEGCDASNNTQTKDSCEGDPGGALASVAVAKDAGKVSATPSSGIAIGDEITVTTTENRLAAETKLDVTGPGGTQKLTIHTSCSDTLVVGEQFGSLILRKYVPE